MRDPFPEHGAFGDEAARVESSQDSVEQRQEMREQFAVIEALPQRQRSGDQTLDSLFPPLLTPGRSKARIPCV